MKTVRLINRRNHWQWRDIYEKPDRLWDFLRRRRGHPFRESWQTTWPCCVKTC